MDLAEPLDRYLSVDEREEIAIGVAQGLGVNAIARGMGRAPSTVSRELRRHAPPGKPGRYRAVQAQRAAETNRKRPKVPKLVGHKPLRDYVEGALGGKEHWSPEQIANRLPRDFPDDEQMRISHETIYQSLFVQGRGALRAELTKHLRTGRAVRKPRARVTDKQTPIKDMIMISERPAEIEDRAVPGHWEGDLIIGANGRSAVGTLVERTSRVTLLLHLPNDHCALTVRDAITAKMAELPEWLRQSLTWDQGIEMAEHTKLALATDLAVYFCDPHSPWQRGTNENTNGLLRQYLPKGTDLSVYSVQDLLEIEAGLNGRPRKTLDWRTPAEYWTELLSGHR